MAWNKDSKKNAEYLAKRKEEDKALEEKLMQGVENVYSSDEWKNFLNMNENFRKFSVENKILVYLQCPEATMVKTANCWNKEYERFVNKGEHGIRIRQPVFKDYEDIDKLRGTREDDGNLDNREKNEKGQVKLLHPQVFYRYISEFDVSQTNGKELPPHEITKQINEKLDNYEAVKAALIAVAPCPVSFADKENDDVLKGGALGYYRPREDRIVIMNGMSEADTVQVLAHEISHSLLHGEQMRVEGIETSANIPSKSEKEVQAESSSYMICAHLGIEADCQSFGYVANYAHVSDDRKKNIEFLKKNLDTICKCANHVIDKIDEELSKEIPLAKTREESVLKSNAAAFLASPEAEKESNDPYDKPLKPIEEDPTKGKKVIVVEPAWNKPKEEPVKEPVKEEVPALITYDTLTVGDKVRTAFGGIVTIIAIDESGAMVENEKGGKMKLNEKWRDILDESGAEIIQTGDAEYGHDEQEKEEKEEDETR